MVIGLAMFVIFSSVIEGKGLPPRDNLNKVFFGINPILAIIIISVFISFLASLLIANATQLINYTASISLFGLFGSIAYIMWIADNKEQRINLIALIILTIFFIFFFAGELQIGSLFNLFAARNVDLNLFGVKLPPSLSQTINPLSIIFFGLLFSSFANFDGSKTLRNFGIGLLCITFAAFVIYLGCANADINSLINPVYFIISISLIGLGEVLIAPFIHSQATLLAPAKLRGFVMGIIMLSISCANYAGIFVAKFMSVPSIKGEVDPTESLAIYKAGFFNIGIGYMVITFIFVIISILFLRKVIVKNN
jgi:POT family proton-dependent oligopeptide transporter